MGASACLKRVSPEIIQKCRDDADYAVGYIGVSQPDTETLNLKDSWDALHYLLSAGRRKPSKAWDSLIVWDSSDLMGVAILGKEIVHPECKYGMRHPRSIEAEQVKDIAELLKDIEWESLEKDFVPQKMMECGVYPEEMWKDAEKAKNYICYWFLQLRKFFIKCASLNQAVICYVKM